MKSLAPFFVMIAILITIAFSITALFNYRLKKKILNSGPLDENAVKALGKLSGMGLEILKWGMILLFGGIGLVVIAFVPYEGDRSPIPYGIETIFVAIGFLVYYFIVRKNNRT